MPTRSLTLRVESARSLGNATLNQRVEGASLTRLGESSYVAPLGWTAPQNLSTLVRQALRDSNLADGVVEEDNFRFNRTAQRTPFISLATLRRDPCNIGDQKQTWKSDVDVEPGSEGGL